jgi:hypothetical protein
MKLRRSEECPPSLLPNLQKRADLFEGLVADAGDLGEGVEGLEGAVLDDGVGGDFADAGETHEFVAGGGVGVDGVGFEGGATVGGEGEFGVFVAFEAAFFGEFVPIGSGPDAGTAFGGLELEVAEFFAVGVGVIQCGGFTIDAEGAGEAFGDELGGEVLSFRGGDEGVDAFVFSIAAGIRFGGVKGSLRSSVVRRPAFSPKALAVAMEDWGLPPKSEIPK